MDLMSEPDAIEEFSDGLGSNLDYRLLQRLVLLESRCGSAFFGYTRDLEIQGVRWMRAASVLAVRICEVDASFAGIVLLSETEPGSDGVAFATTLWRMSGCRKLVSGMTCLCFSK